MNLSIVLSTQPASFSALAYQGKLEENIAKIAELGYAGVELAVRDPSLLDLKALEAVVNTNNLVVPAIGTGQAYGEEGLSVTSTDQSIRDRAIERLHSQAVLAAGFKAVVILGLIRGRAGSKEAEGPAHDLLVEAIKVVAGKATQVKFALEPINRYETDLINTVAAGLSLVDDVGLDNFGLLLDTFHMNIEEKDIAASIRDAGDKLFHLHIADSNRWYPGGGHTDFAAIVEALDHIDYKAFISAEIMPLPDSDTAAAKTIEFMRSITA